ncbi:hypothetical protein MVES1_002359 [Malassezia vespertilionis]|nr:uncharacterized protein MVES1_002359 [Malassezia vespertilionis]WFD07004.1 hypothetical protein MVES1_002359 [Malassezia vespertilionis]
MTQQRPDHAVHALQRPELIGELPSHDMLSALVARNVAPAQGQSERLAKIAMPDATLGEATRLGHWRRIAVCAAEAICTPRHGAAVDSDLDHLLAWWQLRLLALWKLRFYVQVRTEICGLWQVLETTAATDGQPLLFTTRIPFALHILHAQELYMRGEHRTAIEHMAKHLRACDAYIHEATDVSLWKARRVRLQLQLASMLLGMDAHEAASSILDPLADECVAVEDGDAYTIFLALVLVRLYAQMGCTRRATSLLAAAKRMPDAPQHAIETHALLFQHMCTTEAVATLPDATELMELPEDQALVNAMAVDAFYKGDTTAGISTLDRFMTTYPAVFATARGLVGNLVTLYTMSPGVSDGRQRVIRHLAEHAGDDPTGIDSRLG